MSDAEPSGAVVDTVSALVVSNSVKRDAYHHIDVEADSLEPACTGTPEPKHGWTHPSKNQLPFLRPCRRPGCFGGDDDA